MHRKHYLLDENDIEIINEVQSKMGMASASDALRYIIRQYMELEKKEIGTQLAILRSIEENTVLLLDVANSDLIKRNDKVCYPVSMVESPVIKKAREVRKKDLANKKQKKDYRNRKHGN